MQSVKNKRKKHLSIIFKLDNTTQFNKKVIILLSCLFKAFLFHHTMEYKYFWSKSHIEHKKKQKTVLFIKFFFSRYII